MCVCVCVCVYGHFRGGGGGGLLLRWMFEHGCLDTCCFGYLICTWLVFAPVQRN